jgi:farnesyl diphosphate synthase
MNAPTFSRKLDDAAAATERLLDTLLSPDAVASEIARPKRLLDAMRHAALGGGKRLRPFLVVESAALFGVLGQGPLMAGAALECVHCYSLAHDDLPAMDNSDLRRGRPTLHKAFDEATATLAGDALLTIAFDITAREEVHPDATVRIELVSALARAAGIGGMAGGQMLDLEGEGRFGKAQVVDVALLQRMKTGALLRFACVAGAILGQASEAEYAALDTYGRALGEAFQIADDLLDLEGDAATLGKQTGQDAAAGKTNFVTLLGADGARTRLQKLIAEADEALAPFGASAATLRATARFVAERKS